MQADLSIRHRSLTMVIGVAAAIALARSAVFLIWEHADFDSDQAIIGLMAKHIREGRSLPVFFYGQQYMLAVQTWLAAPIFALFGPSIAALKVPLVLVNIATASLLIWVLHRDGGLAPWVAFMAAAFYVLAPPSIAAPLLETTGGNPEPFLYILLLWILRGRPLAFGVVFGIGFLEREFTAYGVTAIVLLAVNGPGRSVRRLCDLARKRNGAISAKHPLGAHSLHGFCPQGQNMAP